MIQNTTFIENVLGAVNQYLKDESKEILERHKKQMNDEIEEKMKEIVAKAGIKIASYARIQDFGHDLVITLHDKEPNSETNLDKRSK